MVLKPYHGVYIFINDGNNNFSQKYFFPVHGCFKAMARDFDGDGNLDISAIGFFADYKNRPEEGFVFLRNEAGQGSSAANRFRPFSFPASQRGRWLTMDAGDFDGDGLPDIVIGNFSIRPAEIKSAANWRNGPPYILLRNTNNQSGKR